MIEWLLDTSMGAPGIHGKWPGWLTVLFHASNALAAVELFALPVVVGSLWAFHRKGVGGWQVVRALCFLPALALCRSVRVIELWGPPYHLTAIVDLIAAACTTISLLTLPRLFRHVLLLPSRQEIHDLSDQLHEARLTLTFERVIQAEKYDRVRRRLEHVEDAIDQSRWADDARQTIASIRTLLNDEPSAEKEVPCDPRV